MVKTNKCGKCGGTGEIFVYSHVKGGICFSCNGTGIKHKRKRVKIVSTRWEVVDRDEDHSYGIFKTEEEAIEVLKEVEDFLYLIKTADPIIVPVNHTQYEYERVVA